MSAHQTMAAEYAIHGGIDRLAAELETLAADTQHDRFVELLRRSGLTPEQHEAVVASSAFGPLTGSLRRAEAYHHDLDRLVSRIVTQHELDDAEDIAAVLRYRVEQAAASPPRGCRLRPRLIAGLIPEPFAEMSAEDRQAIEERKHLIEGRAAALAADDIDAGAVWVRRLGEPPAADPADLVAWRAGVATVAAYRDRYKVTSDLPVGGGASTDAQRADRRIALQAVRRAAGVAAEASPVGHGVAADVQAVSAL
jgi:hypothetical protein